MNYRTMPNSGQPVAYEFAIVCTRYIKNTDFTYELFYITISNQLVIVGKKILISFIEHNLYFIFRYTYGIALKIDRLHCSDICCRQILMQYTNNHYSIN